MNEIKTLIEMALDAGFEEIAFHKEGDSDFVCFTEEIEKFAELVRANENEACAKIADEAEPFNAADLIRKRMKT